MKIPSREEIARYDEKMARHAALQFSQLTSSLIQQNQRQGKLISQLMGMLGEEGQQEIFSKETLAKLQNMLFGDRSEKLPPLDEDGNPLPEGPEDAATPKRKARGKFGRTAQPELPIQEVRHTLVEEALGCPSCGGKLEIWEGQYEESELIQVIPASFVLQKHRRQKYRCRCGGCIRTAPGPVKLKEGSRYAPEVAVEIAVNKYENHLPLERQVKMFRSVALEVESQTLFGLTDDLAWYLKPVAELIRRHILEAGVIFTDETPWKNLAKKKKDERGLKIPNKKFQLWEMASRDGVYFKVFDSRDQESARALLSGIEGVLVCDGLSTYDCLEHEKLKLAGCWAHVRRKFKEAMGYPEAGRFVRLIQEIYRIEEGLTGKPPDEIHAVRQRDTAPLVEKFYLLLLEYANFLPSVSFGAAVKYALGEWDGLKVFLSHPGVPLDNNLAERNLRGPVVGRKNHWGSKSKRGAEVTSTLYSIIETCKMNGVDCRQYLIETIHALLARAPVRMPWEIRRERELAATAVSKTVDSETPAQATA